MDPQGTSTLPTEMTDDAQRLIPIALDTLVEPAVELAASEHDTLKYHLLGPSLTKAGQDSVDQQKVDLRS